VITTSPSDDAADSDAIDRELEDMSGSPSLARELKENLRHLRDGAAGPELAEMAREVLKGDVGLRSVARSSVYADQFTDATGRYQRWHEQLTPEGREQLLSDARRQIRDRWAQEPRQP
jgi:hypothetical protein